MKTILDCETEIGTCDYDLATDHVYSQAGAWTIYAHTQAALTGSKRMLRLEQRCFLRQIGEMEEQLLIRPEMVLEPVLGTERDAVELARQLHEQFVERAHRMVGEGALQPV
jgi:hypothetical protein